MRACSMLNAGMQELGWKRSDYVISTKLFWGGKGVNDRGLSRKHLVEGIKACHAPASRNRCQCSTCAPLGSKMSRVTRG